MSPSEFGQEVPKINDRSTIPELVGFLLSSFREKEFKIIERMLISREEELKRQLAKEQKQRDLLEKIHGEAELENLEIREELNKLKREKLEMQEELKKLKSEKQEAEETAQLYSQKFPEYEDRISYLEKNVAGVLGIELSEIGTRACNSSENDLKKEGNSNLNCKQTAEAASHDCDNAQTSCGAQSPWNGSSDRDKGSKHYPDTAVTSINTIYHKESYDRKQLVLEDSTQVVLSSIPISDRPRSPIIVEIIESDEISGDRKPCVSNVCASEINSSKKEVTSSKSGKSGFSIPAEDENWGGVVRNPLTNLLPKRKRSLTESDDCDNSPVGKPKTKTVTELLRDGKGYIVNNCSVKLDSDATGSQLIFPSAQGHIVSKSCQGRAGADCSPQNVSRKLDFDITDDSSDYSSTDSDDYCSDSYINNMIASLRQDRRDSRKTWNFAADMLSEFQKDNELCMNAVCALYRKKVSAEKSINYTSSPINLGFSQFDAMSGKNLVEFLIDGDPQYKLKRTVPEVQQKDPRLLDRCKDLAIHYYENLFEIYRKGEDPFFHPRS